MCVMPRTYEAPVHSEDLLIDYGSNRKTVETVGEGLPELDVVSSFAYENMEADTLASRGKSI